MFGGYSILYIFWDKVNDVIYIDNLIDRQNIENDVLI